MDLGRWDRSGLTRILTIATLWAAVLFSRTATFKAFRKRICRTGEIYLKFWVNFMNNESDFLCDTLLHISEVKENLEQIATQLRQRGESHDRTKLQSLEFDAFVSTREQFKKANYGTPEYQACVDAVKPAVDHHYKNNRHHTAFYANGINDMTLIDIIEMIADWKAASRRSPDKKFVDTLDFAKNKYQIGDQLFGVIVNTFKELGWI